MKKLSVLLIAFAMVFTLIPATAAYADEETDAAELVYVTIDMPLADFYYGEIKGIEPLPVAAEADLTAPDPVETAGYRAEGVYDALTSASARLRTGQLPTITKKFVDDEGNDRPEYVGDKKDRLVYTGMKDVNIAVPKTLYDSILAAQAEGKECANKALTFFDKDTALLTEAPAEYKVMFNDGSFSKMATEVAVDEDAIATIKAHSDATGNAFGEYSVIVSGVDMAILGDESKLMGEVLTDEDGNSYGMKPVANFYRLAQANIIAFCVTDGFQEWRDKAVRPYKYTAPLEGKTIKKIQFIIKDGADIVVNTDLKVKKQFTEAYDADLINNAVKVDDVQYDKTSMTTDVTFTGLPEGFDKELAAVQGPNGDITKQSAFNEGKLTLTQSEDDPIIPGAYTATFTDDEYIEVTSAFKVLSGVAEDFVKIEDYKLVMNDERYTLDDYKSAMTSVKVNDKERKGTSLNPDLFFGEDGAINFDATVTAANGTVTVYFPEDVKEYTIVIKADGYPDATLTVTRPQEVSYVDGFYTTTVNTDKESYGYVTDADGNITSYGFSYPKSNYDFPVTVEIKEGKIVNVAYPLPVLDIVANTSSDINYLMWAMDGHNVTEYSYNYLAAEGKNYDKYHLDPKPPMNGKGVAEQIIEKQGTEGVDTVTAASITSRAIIKSVNLSLEKAVKGEKDDPEPVLPTPDTTKAVIPVDGVYFVNDVTCVGASVDVDVAPMVLTVKDRVITAQMAVEQRQASYPYIFAGTEAETLAAGEEGWLYPVDYDYGYKYPGSIYKNVPIKSLDKPLNFMMFASGSGNWFNRQFTIASEDITRVPYGDYQADEFTFEGGSGRVQLTCEKVRVTRSGITFDIAFDSTNYTKLVVDGVEYAPVVKDGKSIFTVPLNINGQTKIVGTTVAMSSPTDVEYEVTVKFDAKDLVSIPKTYVDGFYTTTVNTEKERYGYQLNADGSVSSRGFSYPKSNYDFPVTVQIQDGKIVDVAYPLEVIDIVANTSSDINYLMWAMDGHNVNDHNYNYLAADGKNYDKYNVNPKPAMNGVGMRDQIIEKQSTDGVDTVTAATITSRAIIDSVDLSLEKAEKGEMDDPTPVLPTPDTSEDIIPEDGTYTVQGTCVGADLDDERPIVLEVKDGKMIAKEFYVQQRQSSYPYIYAGTEKEALEAGESGWLIPEDYDYGYKYPGSLYRDVPIKSLDKAMNFVMFASGSGNWFNRLITLDSATLKETKESVEAKAVAAMEEAAAIKAGDYSAESYKAVEDAKAALEELLAKEDATAEEIAEAIKNLNDAVEALKIDLTGAKVTLSKTSYTFNNKVQKPTIKTIGGKTLKEGTDYKATWSNKSSKNAGKYTVTIKGIGKYTGETKATYQIKKAANTLTVKTKTATVKYSKVKSKAQTIKRSAVLTVSKAVGTVTYTKTSGNSKITIAKKTGKVTVKKGLKKGTYSIKVKVKAAGNKNYNAKTLTKTFKVKVS
ncbi:MAG: FMN-binding protein [Firmicutes bacterium]|nr:FMN-binding protein [Bacillota bacterium]